MPRSDPLWDDERLVLVVIASGLVVMSASVALQVLWLVTVVLAPLGPRLAGATPGGWAGGPPGADGPDDSGGGGGGGLRGGSRPRPPRPSGVK